MIKENLKKNKILRWIYVKGIETFACMLTAISPRWNTEFRYWLCFHKRINLKNPTTFKEKLLWLKLNRYGRDSLVIQCADKLRVRDYVEQCGCSCLLNELYGVYDGADDIPWEELPQQFVLKWNFGCGMNVICRDKSELDQNEVIRQMKRWGKNKYWLPFSEMQYKYCDKKIICERYLCADVGG